MTAHEKIPPQQDYNGVSCNADLSQPPYFMDGCDTLPKLFRKRAQELGERVAHREKDLGIWLSHSWREYYERARLIALGLVSLGLERDDVISVISEDKKEWMYTDLGAQCAGAIVSGIYSTDSARQLSYLVNDSGSRFLFVENDEQLDKFLSVENEMPGLARVIVFDDEGLHGFTHEKVMFLDELYALGHAALKDKPGIFEEEIEKSSPRDIAILVYTSGTTGPPKGASISQSNIMFSLSSGMAAIRFDATDEQVCFLPLCHILERLFSTFTQIGSRSTVNFAESPETVFDNLREVSPHSFTAVPRVWEKIYSRVTIMQGDATALGRWAYKQALRAGHARASYTIGGQPAPAGVELRYRFWDFLVFKNLRRMLGLDRLRRGGTGAAPISPDLLKWYHAIGVPLLEGYGMTESSGIISINTEQTNKMGSVGKPVPGAEIRIATDGEILYRAGNVFQGYWNKPEKTAETITGDGWLKTGDAGRIDNEGYLFITGRLKDIIITAGGKNITPAEIENRLKFSPYISDAVVIGDRRKFLSCLIMIDQENVEKFAQDHRIPFNDFKSLCAAPEIRDLIGKVVEETNGEFARVEQVRAFRIIDMLLTAEDDELTATMKLKRSFVEEKYKKLIDEMYAGQASMNP